MDSVSNKAKEKIDLVNEDKNLSSTVEDRKTEQGALRKLDVQVAENVMGWKHYQSRNGLRLTFFLSPETYATHYIQSKNLVEVESGNEANAPRYSSDIAAAMQVEDRIAQLGKQNDYIAHLWDEVGAARDSANFWTAQNFNAFWLCVHATPEQRCRAALKATECLSISNDTQPGQAS